VSGASGGLVEPDSYPGVEVLHGTVEVLLRCRGDDVVMVGHENDVVHEKVIFFMGFLECTKENAGNAPLVKPERSVVCPAHQVVG
jgi:hypothetical protein